MIYNNRCAFENFKYTVRRAMTGQEVLIIEGAYAGFLNLWAPAMTMHCKAGKDREMRQSRWHGALYPWIICYSKG